MLSAHWPAFADAPFVGHAGDEGAGNIILRHRVFLVLPTGGKCMAMWCTIRTFRKHALELGNQPAEEPIIFVKPVRLPPRSRPPTCFVSPREVHHEVECVVRLNVKVSSPKLSLVSI